MFWTRTKSVLVFVPLMLVMIYLGGIPFQVFMTILLAIAAREYWRLLQIMAIKPSQFVILSGVLLVALHRILFGFQYIDVLLVVLIFLVAVDSLVRYEKGELQAAQLFAFHLAGILYIGWIGSYFFSIRALPEGRWWLLTALPITWLADMGAYTIGKPLGKHKMLPHLSPLKSWEGFAGAVVFGVATGALLSLLWQPFLPNFSLWQGMLLGLVVALLTPLGDLFISLLKRVAGVKDTSKLIPGHGGILDRLDTWIWGAMIAYYLALMFTG